MHNPHGSSPLHSRKKTRTSTHSSDRIPPKVTFQIQDVEAPWVNVGETSWDLVHVQSMYGCIRSWPSLYAKIFE